MDTEERDRLIGPELCQRCKHPRKEHRKYRKGVTLSQIDICHQPIKQGGIMALCGCRQYIEGLARS